MKELFCVIYEGNKCVIVHACSFLKTCTTTNFEPGIVLDSRYCFQ